MKYIYILILILISGCTRLSFDDGSETVDMTVSITVEGNSSSRSSAYPELSLKSAYILIYNSNHVLEELLSLSGSGSATVELYEGRKYIYVVANAGSSLGSFISGGPKESELLERITGPEDFNSGKLPSQGILMTGKLEFDLRVNNKEANLELSPLLNRIDLYVAKGGSSGNITVKKAEAVNFCPTGYLYRNEDTNSKSTFTVNSSSVVVSDNNTSGKLVGTAYVYPVNGRNDLNIRLTLRHAESQADDTYIIYPNTSNTPAEGVTFERGKHYKVTVTFTTDENGTLTTVGFTAVDNGFNFG